MYVCFVALTQTGVGNLFSIQIFISIFSDPQHTKHAHDHEIDDLSCDQHGVTSKSAPSEENLWAGPGAKERSIIHLHHVIQTTWALAYIR